MNSPDRDRAECAVCGAGIDTRGWHPVATVEADGRLRILPFCGQSCREEWRAERTADTDSPNP